MLTLNLEHTRSIIRSAEEKAKSLGRPLNRIGTPPPKIINQVAVAVSLVPTGALVGEAAISLDAKLNRECAR
jgi:hypothetical protein